MSEEESVLPGNDAV